TSGAGSQPLPGPTTPPSSRAVRYAWLAKMEAAGPTAVAQVAAGMAPTRGKRVTVSGPAPSMTILQRQVAELLEAVLGDLIERSAHEDALHHAAHDRVDVVGELVAHARVGAVVLEGHGLAHVAQAGLAGGRDGPGEGALGLE